MTMCGGDNDKTQTYNLPLSSIPLGDMYELLDQRKVKHYLVQQSYKKDAASRKQVVNNLQLPQLDVID